MKTSQPSGATRHARLVAKEGGGAGAAQLLGGALRYVAAIFATRSVGGAGYGIYTLCLTVTGLSTIVGTLGLSPGILPFLSEARNRGGEPAVRSVVRAALLLVVLTSIVLGALLFGLAPVLGDFVFQKQGMPAVLRVLSPIVLLGALIGTIVVLLQGFMAVKEAAWIESVVSIGVTTAGMALTWAADWGWRGVALSTLAGPAAGILCGLVLLGKSAPGLFSPSAPSAPIPAARLVAYSWPLTGSAILTFLMASTDMLLLGAFRAPRSVGIYAICARLATGVLMTQESLAPIFQARMSDLAVTRDKEGMEHLYQLTTRWSMWIGLACAAALALWARQALLLFGRGFVEGAEVLVVLLAGKCIALSVGLCGRVFAVTGHARLNMFNLLGAVVLNAALNLLLIPRYGILGAAIATSASLVATKALQVAQIWFLHRILPWNHRSLVPLVGIAVLAGAIYPIRHLRGFGLGIWGWLLPLALFVAACVTLFLVVGIAEEDREVWRAVRGRLQGRSAAPAGGNAAPRAKKGK